MGTASLIMMSIHTRTAAGGETRRSGLHQPAVETFAGQFAAASDSWFTQRARPMRWNGLRAASYFWVRLAHAVVYLLGIPLCGRLILHARLCGDAGILWELASSSSAGQLIRPISQIKKPQVVVYISSSKYDEKFWGESDPNLDIQHVHLFTRDAIRGGERQRFGARPPSEEIMMTLRTTSPCGSAPSQREF